MLAKGGCLILPCTYTNWVSMPNRRDPEHVEISMIIYGLAVAKAEPGQCELKSFRDQKIGITN